MYSGLDDDAESRVSRAGGEDDASDNESVRSATLEKIRREVRNLWARAPAGAEPPAETLRLLDVPGEMPVRDLPQFRKRVQRLRAWALGKPAPAPSGEPNEPAEPPKPVSTDPGANGGAPRAAAAPPAGVDEKAEYRRAMKSLREDAVVWSVIAGSKALDPQALFEILRPLSAIDEDGNISLVDPNDETKTLALDAPTLRRLLPAVVAAPAGVTGGSGGKTPNLMPRAPAGRDLVEKGAASQRFYDAHRSEIESELRRREMEKGQ